MWDSFHQQNQQKTNTDYKVTVIHGSHPQLGTTQLLSYQELWMMQGLLRKQTATTKLKKKKTKKTSSAYLAIEHKTVSQI